MKALKDGWNAIFNSGSKSKAGPLNSRQLAAACEIFGDSVSPQCETVKNKAVDYKKIAGNLIKQVEAETGLDQILEGMQTALETIQQAVFELDEYRAQVESQEREAELEKAFFTPTFSKMFLGDDFPSGAYQTRKTSNETSEKQKNSDWVGDMSSEAFGKKQPEPQSQNIYSRHDLRPGKQRM